jgi:hypothetical protein
MSFSTENNEKHDVTLPSIGIPFEVLFHPELTNTEKILFGFMRNMSKRPEGCTASNRYLGGLIGASIDTVSKAVANLNLWQLINVYYESNPDGSQRRRIYVNPRLTQMYEKVVFGQGTLEVEHRIQPKKYGPCRVIRKELSREKIEKAYPSMKHIAPLPSEESTRALLRNHYPPNHESLTPYEESTRKVVNERVIERVQDISGEQSPPVDISNDSHEEKEKKTVQPVDRNEEYMPFAKRLADIIRKKKRINKNSSIRAWTDDLRKLVTIDLVEDDHEAKIARVNRALDWYEQNIGGKFVPDIQSGAAFRQKFTNIENAIERQEQYAGHDTGPSANSRGSAQSDPKKPVDEGLGPRPLFQKEFGKDLGDWLFENAFKPLRDVYSGPDGELLRGVTRSNLAQSIVHMLRQIQDRQKNLPSDFFDTHPYYGFMSILKAYVQHLEEARSWLDTPTLAMLDVSHSIFGRFRKQYARDSDHLARDPFTGLPPSPV